MARILVNALNVHLAQTSCENLFKNVQHIIEKDVPCNS